MTELTTTHRIRADRARAIQRRARSGLAAPACGHARLADPGDGAGLGVFRPPVLGAVAAAVVVVVALAIALSGGGSPGPSLRQAAAPTLRAATLPAPPESSANHARLAVAVDGVPFPYWEDRFGWRSTGTRSDRIDGRTVTTVFYSDAAGRRIGYAILAGTPRHGSMVAWSTGAAACPTDCSPQMARRSVTWLRDGHLCVVSGRGVSSATLLKLASWSDRDASAS